MLFFSLKKQTFFFLFFIQILSFYSPLYEPLQTQKSPHFLSSFLEFPPLSPVLSLVLSYTQDIESRISSLFLTFNKKIEGVNELIDVLELHKSVLEGEMLHLDALVLDFIMELERNENGLLHLYKARQEVIDMKKKESKGYSLALERVRMSYNENKEFIDALIVCEEILMDFLVKYDGEFSLFTQEEVIARRKGFFRLRNLKKKLKNPKLLAILLINEPFIDLAIYNDNIDIKGLLERLNEMKEGLKEIGLGTNGEDLLNKTYKARVEGLYREYEAIMREINLLEEEIKRNKGFFRCLLLIYKRFNI